MEAQRIGTLPDDELAKAYDKARKEARLLHYEELIVVARCCGTNWSPQAVANVLARIKEVK